MKQKSTHYHLRGLLTACVAVLLSWTGTGAQILQKEIKEGTSVVTDPLKTTQKTTKEVAQPIKDFNKGVKDVTNAPKQVTKEVKNTEREFDNLEKEIDKTKGGVDKVAGNDKKDSQQDSTANKQGSKADDGKSGDPTAADGKSHQGNDRYIPADYVPEKKTQPAVSATHPGGDPNDVPRQVPPGSRDNKTPSGPMPAETAKVTGGTDPNPGVSPTVSTDPEVSTDAVSTGNPSRYVELPPSNPGGEKRPRPDYSNSPARIALEKAEHDIETLEDLFKYSNWEGPEREHTVRAVEYALNELQQSIVEIKKLDPGHSTWRFEERYKEMRTAFQKAKQS